MTTHHHDHHTHRIPAHVRPAVRDRIGQHRAHEARLITTALGLVCAVGFTAAVVPAVEHAVTLAVLGALALAVLAGLVRFAARRVQEHREDRADAVTAARWRSVHAPHLLTAADRALLDPPTRPRRVLAGRGVA